MLHLGHRLLFGVVGCILGMPTLLVAAPPTAADFLESPPLVRVEITQPSRLLRHRVVQGFVKQIVDTKEFQHQWDRPESDPVRQVLAYAQRVTGQTGTDGLMELLSGRLSFAMVGPKRYVWIYEFSDATYRERISSELASLGVRQTETPDIRHLGKTTVGLADRWLVGSHDRSIVANALERLTTHESKPIHDESIVKLWLDWKTLNRLNKKADRLQLPVQDVGQLIVFGNWLGLLVGTDELSVDVSEVRDGFQVEILGDGRRDAPASLFGGEAELAPLLNGPSTLWSVSGLRDWSGMWDDRDTLLTPSTIAATEKANEQIAEQFKALKTEFFPLDVVKTLGPQFRWAIARQQNLDYRISEDNSLPAGVLAISLRDAARFREIIAAPMRTVSFIAAFGETKMRVVGEDYEGVKITGLAFRDDVNSVKNFDQRLFNLRPAWATTADHFIMGTTTEIVRNTIDEIQSPSPTKPSGNTIAAQAGSFSQLAAALRDYRRTIVNESVLNNGISPDTANSDFTIFADAIDTLGTLHGELQPTTGGFRYTLMWNADKP